MIPVEEVTGTDYSVNPTGRKYTDVHVQRGFTGGQSERSKKIVYQKGVSSQSPTKLDASGPTDQKNKTNISFDYDIVRDIGTNPIEDESFIIQDLS